MVGIVSYGGYNSAKLPQQIIFKYMQFILIPEHGQSKSAQTVAFDKRKCDTQETSDKLCLPILLIYLNF